MVRSVARPRARYGSLSVESRIVAPPLGPHRFPVKRRRRPGFRIDASVLKAAKQHYAHARRGLILLNGAAKVVAVELQDPFNVRCTAPMRLLDAIKRLPPSIPKNNV